MPYSDIWNIRCYISSYHYKLYPSLLRPPLINIQCYICWVPFVHLCCFLLLLKCFFHDTVLFFYYPPASLTQPTKKRMCCYFCLTKPITLRSKSDFRFNIFVRNKVAYSCLFLLFWSYDEEADKVNQYQRLDLVGLEKIEIGKTLESF